MKDPVKIITTFSFLLLAGYFFYERESRKEQTTTEPHIDSLIVDKPCSVNVDTLNKLLDTLENAITNIEPKSVSQKNHQTIKQLQDSLKNLKIKETEIVDKLDKSQKEYKKLKGEMSYFLFRPEISNTPDSTQIDSSLNF
jgi:ABC-type proline/glycine betaine transport system substrate-binding protein